MQKGETNKKKKKFMKKFKNVFYNKKAANMLLERQKQKLYNDFITKVLDR